MTMMKRPMWRTALFGLSAAAVIGTSACAPAEETPDAGTTADAGTVTDGGTDTDGGNTTVAATCDEPIVLDGSYTGSLEGATVDMPLSCDGQGGTGKAQVFSFTLDEDAGVEFALEEEFDGMLAVLGGDCMTEVDSGCMDSNPPNEALSFGLLSAGTYHVVVKSYGPEPADGATWDYTLTATVTAGGICVNDQFEGETGDQNNTPAGAPTAGANDIDTADLGDPDTPGPDPLRLAVCGDDVDFYVVEHMGGALNATISDASLSAELLETTGAPGGEDFAAGTKVGDLPYDGDLGRGIYLLRMAAGAEPVAQTGAEYSFAVTHGCHPDEFDKVLETEDDSVLSRAAFDLSGTPEMPTARSICTGDVDTFTLTNIAEGDITVTLTGGAALTVEVGQPNEETVDDADDVVAVADAMATVMGDDLVVTIPAAAAGTYVVKTVMGMATGNVDYGVTATFGWFTGAPANDECSGATAMTLTTDTPSSVFGWTLEGTDHITGPCGDEDNEENMGEGTNDVFHSFVLDAASNVSVSLQGENGFNGQVYLLQAEGEACPADLSMATVVKDADMEAICATGSNVTLKYPMLAAGTYFAVVDGVYSPAFDFLGIQFPETRTEGAFNLSVTPLSGDFPLEAVCQMTTDLTLPADGATETVMVDVTTLVAEHEGYGTCGGEGQEAVYTFTPAADQTLTFTSTGYDTILTLMNGGCGVTDQVVCNDDTTGIAGNGSQITADVVAGETYYLILDAYSVVDMGTATLEIFGGAPMTEMPDMP